MFAPLPNNHHVYVVHIFMDNFDGLNAFVTRAHGLLHGCGCRLRMHVYPVNHTAPMQQLFAPCSAQRLHSLNMLEIDLALYLDAGELNPGQWAAGFRHTTAWVSVQHHDVCGLYRY